MNQRQAGIVVLTGAGVSADSGIDTFRGAGGLWEGHSIEEVATPEAWRSDPTLVWRFYQRRRAELPEVEPNAAHRALSEFEERVTSAGSSFTLITQNVDDLHERAGSKRLLHMHGELLVLACEACGARARNSEDTDERRFLACDACGHEPLRPDVVWFGEMPYHLDLIHKVMEVCTHFFAIGTSGAVYPAAGLLAIARATGASTWVNSLDPPENLGSDDRFVPGRAAEVVPELLAEVVSGLGG